MRVGDKASPYGPWFEMDGKRAPIPSDFRGPQTDALASIISRIQHPALRARVADTVWLNDRKRRLAADAAVDALVELVAMIDAGTLKYRHEPTKVISRRSIDYVQRAIQIAWATTKAIPEQVQRAATMLAERCETQHDVSGFERIATLCLRFNILPSAEIANRAIALQSSATETYPITKRELYQLTAQALKAAGDEDGSTEARLQAAEMLVKMGEGMEQASAKAHWLMEAIRDLRTIPKTRERRKQLEAELRDLQRDALDEMGQFSVPIDIKPLIENTEQQFQGLSVGDALRQLALISRPREVADLRKEVDKIASEAPLSAMFGMTHVDSRDGKVISTSPGAATDGASSEDWYNRQICQNERLHRQLVVAGSFEPARRAITIANSIHERHFQAIVDLSPFVPSDYQHIFALGFARLLQGDFTSATFLLLPQLENSLRYVLQQVGSDPTMIQSDMVQEDRSLSALLEAERPALDRVFGEAMVSEIDRLFNLRAGPALRHELAHGKISTGHSHSTDIIYACWLMYQLTCVPLLGEDWDKVVGPSIESACA